MREFVYFTKYYYRYQMKKGEMGGICSARGRMTNGGKLWLECVEGKHHLEELVVDGKINENGYRGNKI